ncbi:MAG: dockerin type I domain-containing protein [Verrucomicrobiota bacterium]
MNEMKSGDEQPEKDLEAPEPLVVALKELHNQRVFVPPQVDEAILAQAREQLPQTVPERPGWVAFAPWVALAACGVLLLAITAQQLKSRHEKAAAVFAREDINRDGTVDVLDALALAKKVESGAGTDVNGDGVVDQRDAAAIAQHAVKLEKGGRS